LEELKAFALCQYFIYLYICKKFERGISQLLVMKKIPYGISNSETITTGTYTTRTALRKITAVNVIEENAKAVYRAGEEVVLKPGFHAKAGSNFHAYVRDCSEYSYNTFSTQPVLHTIEADNNVIERNHTTTSTSTIENFIYAYPNPTNDIVYIETNGTKSPTHITMYNHNGQMVTQIQTTDHRASINLNPFKNGIYYLHIANEHSVKTIKIIKQ